MKIIKRTINYVNKFIGKLRPIPYARGLGVTVGQECRFASLPSFGSEPWLISLGNHVEVSSNVTFLTHDGSTWCFRNTKKYLEVLRFGKIRIEDNCFIGHGSTILLGVQIGPNSIVGASSLVTKDIPPNSVWGGVPAHHICTLEEFADKCLSETPSYDRENYYKDKRQEVLKMLENK